MRWKSCLHFFFIYLLIIFASALLTPFIYQCVQFLNTHSQSSFINYLAHKPLNQYFDRIRIAVLVLTLPYFIKSFKINANEFHLRLSFRNFLIAIKNFFTAVAFWLILFILLYTILPIQIKPQCCHFNTIIQCLVASTLLAIIEELVFRGFLFSALKQILTKRQTLLTLGFAFSLLHFSHIREIPQEIPCWLGGFYSAYFSNIDIFTNISWPYFFNLFFLNAILCNLYEKSQTLWASIGFHAGLVFTLMVLRKNVTFAPTSLYGLGTGRLTDSYIVASILAIILFFQTKSKKSNTANV